jgi:hypothetical protein
MKKRTIGCTAAITIAIGLTGQAQQPTLPRTLTVCLTISEGLAIQGSLRAAILSEVNRIWRPLGVAVGIRDESESACDRPILVKSDHEATPEDAGSETAIAWVPFAGGRARQVVFVRVDRARMLIDAFSRSSPGIRPPGLTDQFLAKLLGRSLAHEVGHILLNSLGHERSGLMRARYGAHDMLRDLPSDYRLNARQRDRLYARPISETHGGAR